MVLLALVEKKSCWFNLTRKPIAIAITATNVCGNQGENSNIKTRGRKRKITQGGSRYNPSLEKAA